MTKARDLGDFISDGTIAETVTADGLNLGDNEKIQLGASQDLQIFHDGSHSIVKDSGTGNLKLLAENFSVQDPNQTEQMILATPNGSVNLYYDAVKKFETTATGATVTGTIAVSGDFNATSGTFTVQSNGTDILNVTSTLMSPQTDGAISIGSASNAFNDLHLDGSATIAGITYPTSDGSSGQFLKTDGSGNLSFATVSTSVSINDLTDATTVGSGVGLGSSANNSITSGIKNIAVGEISSRELTTASETVSVGHASGLLTTTGSYNVNLGAESNYYNVTGNSNVSVGRRSLHGASGQSHSRDTAIGYQSGFAITTGSDNFFGGYQAGNTTTTGSNNIVLGSGATASSATVSDEITLGSSSTTRFRIPGIQAGATNGQVLTYNSVTGLLYLATQPTGATSLDGLSDARVVGTSIGIGSGAMDALTATSADNVVIGVDAGTDLTTGDANTLVGWQAGHNITTGRYNVCVGTIAGEGITTGQKNVFLGRIAGYNTTTASDNISIGTESLYANSTGQKNVAIGTEAMRGLNGTNHSNNVAVGFEALRDIQTSSDAVAIGYRAMQNMETGNENVAVGTLALQSATDAGFTVAVGRSALTAVTSGEKNIGIGADSGKNLTSGDNNTCIGYNSTASNPTVSNEFTLGNSSINNLRCADQSISGLSDGRDKTNVKNLDAGLDFIRSLRPVSFDWKTRDGAKVGIPDTGFIAQELSSAQEDSGVTIPCLVTTATNSKGDEQFEAAYTRLIPSLVLAIKELSEKVKTLEAQANK